MLLMGFLSKYRNKLPPGYLSNKSSDPRKRVVVATPAQNENDEENRGLLFMDSQH